MDIKCYKSFTEKEFFLLWSKNVLSLFISFVLFLKLYYQIVSDKNLEFGSLY